MKNSEMLDRALAMLSDDMDGMEGHEAMSHSLDDCPDPLSCPMHGDAQEGNPGVLEIEISKDDAPKKLASGGDDDFNPGGEKGKLHRELGISDEDKIPKKRLHEAMNSNDPEVRRDAIRANTMEHWDKKADGGQISPASAETAGSAKGALNDDDIELLKKILRGK